MKFFKTYKEYNLINEGGIYGNIFHPYNDNNMTFSDIKNMIVQVLNDDMDLNMKEKVDGISLAVSIKNGIYPVFIRNKQHVLNNCNNAIDILTFNNIFKEKGKGYNGFIRGSLTMEKLFNAINVIDPMFLDYIFENGKNVLTFEILSKDFINVIKYDKEYIVFHELISYDNLGNVLKKYPSKLEDFLNFIEKHSINIIDNFNLKGPQTISILPKKEILEYFLKKIDVIMGLNDLTDHNPILDYKIELKMILQELGDYVINNMEFPLGKSQDNEIPSEGIIFTYNNRLYKLTGSFHNFMVKNLQK